MIDIVLVAILLYLVIVSVYKGFLDIFFKFTGIGLGIFLAILYYKKLGEFLLNYFNGDKVIIDLFAFLIIFIFVFTLFFLINALIYKFIHRIHILKIIDKILGFFAGLVLYTIILYALTYFSEKNEFIHEISSDSKIIQKFKQEVYDKYQIGKK